MPKTAQRVANLADKAACIALASEPKRYRVTDTAFPSLKLVVETDGRKYWTARYVSGGKNTEKGLGRFPARLYQHALDDAQKLDRDIRHSERRLDPAAVRRKQLAEERAVRDAEKIKRADEKAAKEKTFRSMAERYLKASEDGSFRDHSRDRPKAASTIAKERLFLNNHILPRMGDRPITEIKRREMIGHLDEIAVISESGHNACLEAVRRVFAYAIHLDEMEYNPALAIHPRKLPSRDKRAGHADLRILWLALEEAKADRTFKNVGTKRSESYAAAAAIQLALVTLQRRGEVVTMRREDVDLEEALWTIPADVKKERRVGLVPLSPLAVELVGEAFERSDCDWAFPGTSDDRKRSRFAEGADRTVAGHLMPKTVTRFMARLRERAGVKDITPHDLRRTGRTALTGELGIDERTAERILNHVVGSAQQRVYDRNEYLPQKRAGLEAWAVHLRRVFEHQVLLGIDSRLQSGEAAA